MSTVCDRWGLEELESLSDEEMERLLEYYDSGTVPSLRDLRGGGFDGSFGWHI